MDVGHEQQLREAIVAFFGAPITVQIEFSERVNPLPGGKIQNMVCEA